MAAAKKTILVVEDNRDLRQMFRMALSLEGFTVLEAADGIQALTLVDAHAPDLVVLDLGLPVLDGVAVQQEIAAQPRSRHTPVLIVTASTEDLSHLDADCILRKPVQPDEVVSAVRQCLAETGRTSS